MTKLFFQLCNKHFRFLIEEFGCRVVGKKSESYGDEVTYQNATTAVKIRFEIREHYVFILLCRIIHGKIPQGPIFIRPKTKLYRFSLDDLLTIRSPSTRIRRRPFGETIPEDLTAKQIIEAVAAAPPFSKHDLEHMIKTYAAGLHKHGADILRGDFTVFAQLENIVKKRAAESKKKEK